MNEINFDKMDIIEKYEDLGIEELNSNQLKEMILSDVDPILIEEKRKARKKAMLSVFALFGGIIIVILVVFFMLLGISKTDGNSMYPTLHDKDTLIYRRSVLQYKAGDIIALKYSDYEDYVKRIIAVAGDVVEIQNGSVYVNGKKEEYDGPIGETKRKNSKIRYPYTVQEGEVFVLGDNREISNDSRNFGAVKESDIKGKVIYYFGNAE